MSADELISAYLDNIRARLELPSSDRRRVIEEIDGHLRDTTNRYIDEGIDPIPATRLAIKMFGPAVLVASEFGHGETLTTPVAPSFSWTGPSWRRWSPPVLPVIFAVLSLGLVLSWLSGGPNLGERAALVRFFPWLVIYQAIAFAAWQWVRRHTPGTYPGWQAWAIGLAPIVVFVVSVLSNVVLQSSNVVWS